MREILFRGKTNFEGRDTQWVYGGLLPESANTFPIIVRDYDNDEEWIGITEWATVDPETVGQYTGLTDKNGKRIFEGDIISIMFETDGVDGFTGYTWYESATVIFSEEKYAWLVVFNDGGEEMYLSEYDGYDDVVVIGNIHDKPELLSGNVQDLPAEQLTLIEI